MNTTTDFFISYAGPEEAWAEWIAYTLDQAGYAVGFQPWDFRSGRSKDGAQTSDMEAALLLSVLSPSALKDPKCQMERDRARDEINVRVKRCVVRGIPPLDLYRLEEAAAREALLAAAAKRRPPRYAPVAPAEMDADIDQAPLYPGGRPAIWNLEPPEGPGEAGDALHALLERDGFAAAPLDTSVHYAFDHADQYDLVWHLRADDLETGMAGLAERMELPDARAARARLERGDINWLLIVEGGTDRGTLPPGGRVLLA